VKIEEVRIDEISNHERNPKQHPDKQIRLLEESIKRFGWTNPVILSADNTILAGHARVKAAIAAGNDTVPCIRTKLTGAEADAYLIADNRLSDLAPYDRDILAELLGELPDDLAELTGFDSSDIDALLKGEDISEIDRFISDKIPDFQPIPEDEVPRLDEKKKAVCPECGHEFTP
jgi:ParB-like chromosome segregation protein Spo0J